MHNVKTILFVLFIVTLQGFLFCDPIEKVISISGGKILYRSLTKSGTGELIKKNTVVSFGDYLCTGKKTVALKEQAENYLDKYNTEGYTINIVPE